MDFQSLFSTNHEFESRTFDWVRLVFSVSFRWVRFRSIAELNHTIHGLGAIGFDLLCQVPILPLFFLALVKPNKMARKRNKAISFTPGMSFAWRLAGVNFNADFLCFPNCWHFCCIRVVACVASWASWAQIRSFFLQSWQVRHRFSEVWSFKLNGLTRTMVGCCQQNRLPPGKIFLRATIRPISMWSGSPFRLKQKTKEEMKNWRGRRRGWSPHSATLFTVSSFSFLSSRGA